MIFDFNQKIIHNKKNLKYAIIYQRFIYSPTDEIMICLRK